MIKKLERLYTEVEIKRHILHERIKFYKDFTHPDIVNLSQELDSLLNQIDMEKKKSNK